MAIFGLKQIDYQVIYLDNDDVDTPTALVGKKVGSMSRRRDLPRSYMIVWCDGRHNAYMTGEVT